MVGGGLMRLFKDLCYEMIRHMVAARRTTGKETFGNFIVNYVFKFPNSRLTLIRLNIQYIFNTKDILVKINNFYLQSTLCHRVLKLKKIKEI